MNILVINGPNMNMLGVREPEIYGRETLTDLENMIRAHCESRGVNCEFFQSNHESFLNKRLLWELIQEKEYADIHGSGCLMHVRRRFFYSALLIRVNGKDPEALRNLPEIRALSLIDEINENGFEKYMKE